VLGRVGRAPLRSEGATLRVCAVGQVRRVAQVEAAVCGRLGRSGAVSLPVEEVTYACCVHLGVEPLRRANKREGVVDLVHEETTDTRRDQHGHGRRSTRRICAVL